MFPQRLIGLRVDDPCFPSLRDDDMVKVARHLESAFLAVGSISNAEAFLHAWLPRPRIDGVLAARMTSTLRRRAW